MSQKKVKIIAGFGLVAMLLIPFSEGFQNLDKPPALGPSRLAAAIPHPVDAEKTLLAVANQIYEAPKNNPNRSLWEKFGSLPEAGSAVSVLLYFPETPETLFALTPKSIFSREWEDQRWKKVFAALQSGQILTDFTLSSGQPEQRWAGTSEGLLHSQDSGKSWRPVSLFSGKNIQDILAERSGLWVATSDGIFLSKSSNSFSKVLDQNQIEEAANSEETFSSESESDEKDDTGRIELAATSTQVWVLTHGRFFASKNQGRTWNSISQSGLSSPPLHLIAGIYTGRVFAASQQEVFEWREDSKRWQKIAGGWGKSEVLDLMIQEGQQEILVLTSSGIFHQKFLPQEIIKPSIHITSPSQLGNWEVRIQREPSAVEVQQMAVRFANAGSGKINRWHAESRLRALLPNVSFGKDFNWGNNIDIDRRGTNDPDTFIEGPSDISRGWDFDVSWDLGDLIFSTSQTSIDSRDKLTAELRRDLTAEVTRLYYERRRAQMEALLYPEEDEGLRLEQQLRVEELTALLDAMTGGWFSQQVHESNENEAK